jgi:cell division protein YceG involved in septum cleavage
LYIKLNDNDMKRKTMLVVVLVLFMVTLSLLLWQVVTLKNKPEPMYNNRVIITNSVGDTLLDRNIESLSPMELDSLTLYLIKR